MLTGSPYRQDDNQRGFHADGINKLCLRIQKHDALDVNDVSHKFRLHCFHGISGIISLRSTVDNSDPVSAFVTTVAPHSRSVTNCVACQGTAGHH